MHQLLSLPILIFTYCARQIQPCASVPFLWWKGAIKMWWLMSVSPAALRNLSLMLFGKFVSLLSYIVSTNQSLLNSKIFISGREKCNSFLLGAGMFSKISL